MRETMFDHEAIERETQRLGRLTLARIEAAGRGAAIGIETCLAAL